MNSVSDEVLKITEIDLASIVMRFMKSDDENTTTQIAKEILNLIDWDNPYLMHKGLSWIAKNYLLQRNLI